MDAHKAYEEFKLRWMISHGYTLTDLINELEKLRNDYDDTTLSELFVDWEDDYGFGSEIWPCFNEYLSHEFLEVE